MIDSPVRTVFCDLADHALIRVAGADARSFLQGQLSNDVREVTASQSQLTSLNTPQGRTLALMRLLELDDELILSLPRPLQMPTVARLRQYVLRAQVSLDPADGLTCFGIAGESAALALTDAGIVPPASVNAARAKDSVAVIRVPAYVGERFEIYGRGEKMAALRSALAERCDDADTETWRLLDTLAGIPLLSPETSGAFVAQMLNLDQLGAISFNKGCYAGQEVIARAHYRGQVKRRLQLVFRSQPAEPGTTVALSENESGTVVQSARTPRQEYATLVVAPVNSITALDPSNSA